MERCETLLRPLQTTERITGDGDRFMEMNFDGCIRLKHENVDRGPERPMSILSLATPHLASDRMRLSYLPCLTFWTAHSVSILLATVYAMCSSPCLVA